MSEMKKVVWSTKSTKGVADIVPYVHDSGEVLLPEPELTLFNNHEIEVFAAEGDVVAQFVVDAAYNNRPEVTNGD